MGGQRGREEDWRQGDDAGAKTSAQLTLRTLPVLCLQPMGCDFCKQSRGGSVGCPEPAGVPKHDPRLPLTAKQKYNMMASWKGISRAMEQTGVNMFIKLFEEHGELLELFAKLKELRTKEEQASSLELAEHATKVMNTLDEGIKELDDLDNFFTFLTNIGQSHKKIPGFKPEYFWKIEKPFLEAVEMTLGDRYTENVENIYKVTIKLIIETLVKGYNT